MMLAPGEIRNKVFEKTRNGYRTEEVQPFLGEIASQMESMLEERADLQRKLEILAEKVEQYREDEDSLRAALIGAQKLGDSVVRDSKRKAEAIIAQATRKAEEMVADAQSSIDREAVALSKMQMEVAKFKTQILTLYKKHIELIQEIPYDETDMPKLENNDMQYIANIGETVEVTHQVAEDAEDSPAAPANKFELHYDAEDPAEEGDGDMLIYGEGEEAGDSAGEDNIDAFPKKRQSRFGTLRFGDDFSLTRKE